MKARVVITGAGVVSPLGYSLASTREALARGLSGTDVRDFDPRPSFITPKAIKMTDRPAQFAVAAAREALDASGWQAGDHVRPLGVLMGTSGHDVLLPDIAAAIGVDDTQRAVTDTAWCTERLMSGLPPLWLVTVLPNMISAHVAMQTSASGPCSTLMSAEAAGLQAIGEAAEWIWSGEADVALAGASDSALNPFVCTAFEQAGLTHVHSEGAGVFVLERRDQAVGRGAVVLAEVLAYASSGAGADACDRAVAIACAEAGVTRKDLRWTAGDVTEDDVPHVGFTAQLGHALSASVPITLAVALADVSPAHQHSAALVAICGTTGPSVAIVLRLGSGREH